MKNIDIKSLLIGGLLASTIYFGVAAAGPKQKQLIITDDQGRDLLGPSEANHVNNGGGKYGIVFRGSIGELRTTKIPTLRPPANASWTSRVNQFTRKSYHDTEFIIRYK